MDKIDTELEEKNAIMTLQRAGVLIDLSDFIFLTKRERTLDMAFGVESRQAHAGGRDLSFILGNDLYCNVDLAFVAVYSVRQQECVV